MLAKYNVLPTIRNLLVFGVGFNLPTGKTDTLTNAGGSGPEEPTIQLGRGNVGLVGSAYQTYELFPHRLGQFSSIVYRHTFKNNAGYQFGDDYVLAAGLNLLLLDKVTLTGQFNYRYVVHDTFSSTLGFSGPDSQIILDRPVPTTGSTMLAFSPGVTWYIRDGTAVYFQRANPHSAGFQQQYRARSGLPRGSDARLYCERALIPREGRSRVNFLSELLPRGGHGQLAVLDAFRADQAVGHGAHVFAFPLHDEHLNTVVVIQVDMHRGEDQLMKVVLNGGELLCEVVCMVIIDNRNRADRCFLFVPIVFNEMVPDQIANRF